MFSSRIEAFPSNVRIFPLFHFSRHRIFVQRSRIDDVHLVLIIPTKIKVHSVFILEQRLSDRSIVECNVHFEHPFKSEPELKLKLRSVTDIACIYPAWSGNYVASTAGYNWWRGVRIVFASSGNLRAREARRAAVDETRKKAKWRGASGCWSGRLAKHRSACVGRERALADQPSSAIPSCTYICTYVCTCTRIRQWRSPSPIIIHSQCSFLSSSCVVSLPAESPRFPRRNETFERISTGGG